MSHPATSHNFNILTASSGIRARIAATVRVLSKPPAAAVFPRTVAAFSLDAIAITVLVAAMVLLSGCAVGSFELVRPDGVTVRASAMALFRDTGLENFTYTVTEDEKGAGLLPSKATRNASVGASGYRGSTNIDAVIQLLQAVK